MVSKYGNITVTAYVGDMDEITYKSMLEYRYAVYLSMLKQAGEIKNWWYENPAMRIDFDHGRKGNVRGYLPDFSVELNDGSFEIHETKGMMTQLDVKKLRAFAEQRPDAPIHLIFADLPEVSKNAKKQTQIRLVQNIEPFLARLVRNANRDLFKPIKFMMDY